MPLKLWSTAFHLNSPIPVGRTALTHLLLSALTHPLLSALTLPPLSALPLPPWTPFFFWVPLFPLLLLLLALNAPRTERTALSDSYMGARDFKHFCRMLGVNRWPAKSLRSLHMMQVTMRHHVGFEPMQRETEAYVHRLRTKSISLQEFLSKGLPDNIIRIRRLLYNYLNTIYPKT